MPERRLLVFTHVDEIMPEVDRLTAAHAKVGQWTLAQICHHIASGIRYSTVGPPCTAEPTREEAVIRKRFFGLERFPDGAPAPPGTEPPTEIELEPAIELLRKSITRFATATDPAPLHPRLGPLSHDDWARFHCLHAAHHLGFLVPGE